MGCVHGEENKINSVMKDLAQLAKDTFQKWSSPEEIEKEVREIIYSR